MAYVHVACRALLVVVFLVACLSKASGRRRFTEFAGSLADLNWLPAGARRPLAASVLAVEAAVVALLAVPSTVAAGFALGGAALAAFTGVVAWTRYRGGRLTCRCFGNGPAGGEPAGATHLVRNGLLLAVAAAGLLTTPGPGSGLRPMALTAAVAGAVVGLVLVRLTDLVYLFGRPAPVRR
jgi:hypothetical protein